MVPDEERTSPVLVVLGGLPATGKSTIARELARRLGAAHVRVDTIETAIHRAEGHGSDDNVWELPPGYEVARDVAADQLRVGRSVVADSVNPLTVSRVAWRDVAARVGARLLEVEVVCSDPQEHRRRAEERSSDIKGLTCPTWEEIVNREYEPWDGDRVVVDTARTTAADAVDLLVVRAGERRATGST